jgi:hypothetical protein
VSGFRNSAWLREAHDRAECPDLCALCDREDAAQDREQRGARDMLTTFDYEEPA